MDNQVKRQILERRIEALRGHIDNVGPSPGFERELQRAEAELREVEQREETPQGSRRRC